MGPSHFLSSLKGTIMKRILIVCVVVFVGTFLLSSCSTSSAETESKSTPESSVGVYSSEDWTATVTADEIIIEMLTDDDSKFLYWKGTWEDGKSTVVSTADRAALDKSIMGSGADTKEFKFEDDSIVFEFKALGSTTNVNIEKD